MEELSDHTDIKKVKQNQILKLVTNSFYKELVGYGIDNSDIVTVSVNLLDNITRGQKPVNSRNGYYNKIYSIDSVKNLWARENCLAANDITLRPLDDSLVAQITNWLHAPELSNTFISFFPKDESELRDCLLGREDRQYFSIYYQDSKFVGIIGAENIDHSFKKLEMKKLVGDHSMRSMGIGKTATFLFLYYVFKILNFNKVYIHSLDTNIKNINLNSKFGFELEGILYQEARLEGAFRDVLRMGLLKDTWQSIFSAQRPE